MLINRKSLLAKIIVFLIIAIIGYFFYTRTLSNYRVTSSVTTGIVAGRYPYHDYEMKVNYFEMDINTQKQTVYLSFGIAYYSKGNYSVLLTLPYRIASYENLRSGTWYVRNAVSGSVVMATFEAENVSEIGWSFQTLRIALHTQDSIGDKIFETNSISLPFGGSITLDIQEKLDELREIVPISLFGDGFNGTLRLSVPYSAVITGTTKQIERRDPAQDFQVFEFRINEFKPFQLQYIDSAQRRDFETNLLLSGTIFGVAVSGFAGIAIELITAKYQNSDEKKSNNGIKMVNQSEGKKGDKTVQLYSEKILNLMHACKMEKSLFRRVDFLLAGFALAFMLSSLVLFHYQEFILLAIIFSILGLLLSGMTVGTFSARISEFVSKSLHMEEKFRNVTIEELRREDDISLASISVLQTALFVIINFIHEIINIEIVNALVILSGLVFFLVRAIAKLRDSNKLRFVSIITLFTLGFVDLIIVMWILRFDFQIYYLVSTVLIFALSLIFASLKYRYIKAQDKRAPIYLI